MNFNTIHYQLSGQQEIKAWRFRQGQGKYQNLWALVGDRDELVTFTKAVQFLLGKVQNHQFERCAIEISDASGHLWRLEKTETSELVSKNGNIQTDSQALGKMHLALKDIDVSEMSINKNLQEALEFINVYGIGGQGQNLWAAPWTSEWKKTNDINDFISEKKETLLKECAFHFGNELFAEPDLLSKLTHQIEPLYWAFSENQKQIQSCMKSEKYIDTNQNCDYGILQKQIQIIEDVDQLHGKLTAHGTTISDRKKSIGSIKIEISAILEHVGLSEIPSPGQMPDWTIPIETLTKLQVIERLIRLTAKAKESVDNHVAPVIEQHFSSLSEVIEDQLQCTEELESCLSSINLKLASEAASNPLSLESTAKKEALEEPEIPSQKEKIDLVFSWFDRLTQRKKLADAETEPEQVNSTDRLETLRMSIEFALSKFHELKSNIQSVQNQAIEPFNEIDAVQERQIRSYKALKAKWQSTCDELGLPEKTKLNQLVKIVVCHIKLFELAERLRIMQGCIEDRKSSMMKLESLIFEWRRLNNSQKKTGLENSAILLNEARSILIYRDDRKKKILGYEETLKKNRSTKDLKQLIESRNKELQTNWDAFFSEANIRLVDISDKKCEKLFSYSSAIKNIDEISSGKSGDSLASAFSRLSSGGINFWQWENRNHNNHSRLTLLKAVENCDFSDPNFFLLEDNVLGDFFQKLGIGSATLVSSKGQNLQTNDSAARMLTDNRRTSTEDAPLRRQTVLSKGFSEPAGVRGNPRVVRSEIKTGGAIPGSSLQSKTARDPVISIPPSTVEPVTTATRAQTSTLSNGSIRKRKSGTQSNAQTQHSDEVMSAKAKAVLDILNRKPRQSRRT